MATIVEMINPLTGLPEQVDKLDHTAQEIDDAVDLAPQLSNPNLLDNWYFGNPVNQRNVSGTIDTVGYFLDRWKLVSGSVTIGSNGITLNGTIVQILETAVGTDIPASALTTEGVVVASYDNNSKTFSLTGTGQTFVAAKLELGSQQTLAHQDENGNWVLNEIPDYGEQLRRCQRYQFVPHISSWTSYQFTFMSGNLIGIIPFPVTMRTIPSVVLTGKQLRNNAKGYVLTLGAVGSAFKTVDALTYMFGVSSSDGTFVEGDQYSFMDQIIFDANL